MRNKGGRHRATYFVLSAISHNNELISENIEAKLLNEAVDIFEKKFSISPERTYGPFYKKRARIFAKMEEMVFTKRIKAIYNGWLVDAWLQENLKNQALLVFIKRVDGTKMQKPQEKNLVVPTSELQII
jgi:hypothetical protein